MKSEAPHDRIELKSEVYKYSNGYMIRTAFAAGLFWVPVIASIIFSVVKPPWLFNLFDPMDAELSLLVMVGASVVCYFTLSRHQLLLNGQELSVRGVFGIKRIDLRQVAEIVPHTMRSGDYLHLYDRDGHSLITIDDDYADSDTVWENIKRHSRSPNVMVFKLDGGWREQPNIENSEWRPSQGPKANQGAMLRSWRLLIAGALLIALTYWTFCSFQSGC